MAFLWRLTTYVSARNNVPQATKSESHNMLKLLIGIAGTSSLLLFMLFAVILSTEKPEGWMFLTALTCLFGAFNIPSSLKDGASQKWKNLLATLGAILAMPSLLWYLNEEGLGGDYGDIWLQLTHVLLLLKFLPAHLFSSNEEGLISLWLQAKKAKLKREIEESKGNNNANNS